MTATGVLCLVAALIGTVLIAIIRDIATREARGALLRLAEAIVRVACARLPDSERESLESEWTADVSTQAERYGPISAVFWAWGVAHRAAPRIAQSRLQGHFTMTRLFPLFGYMVPVAAFSWQLGESGALSCVTNASSYVFGAGLGAIAIAAAISCGRRVQRRQIRSACVCAVVSFGAAVLAANLVAGWSYDNSWMHWQSIFGFVWPTLSGGFMNEVGRSFMDLDKALEDELTLARCET